MMFYISLYFCNSDSKRTKKTGNPSVSIPVERIENILNPISMDSIRQQKISKVLQAEMSSLLIKELKHLCGKALVTVTFIRVTPDLGIARINLSIFAVEDKQAILQNFTDNVSEIRFHLGKKIRHQVRHIPELQFYIDDSLDFIERIDKALKQ